jgi:hypothetical protein
VWRIFCQPLEASGWGCIISTVDPLRFKLNRLDSLLDIAVGGKRGLYSRATAGRARYDEQNNQG